MGERFEDVPAQTVASPPRETSGPSHVERVDAPTTTNTSKNVCLRCAQPGHFVGDCNNQRVPFCWNCVGSGVLTKSCCRQHTRQHTQARGMTLKEAIEQRKLLPGASKKIKSMNGNTFLTVGGLTITGVVDTVASRSIIPKDMIGFIPHIIATEASGKKIRTAAGSLRDSKLIITVEVNLGDVFSNL